MRGPNSYYNPLSVRLLGAATLWALVSAILFVELMMLLEDRLPQGGVGTVLAVSGLLMLAFVVICIGPLIVYFVSGFAATWVVLEKEEMALVYPSRWHLAQSTYPVQPWALVSSHRHSLIVRTPDGKKLRLPRWLRRNEKSYELLVEDGSLAIRLAFSGLGPTL